MSTPKNPHTSSPLELDLEVYRPYLEDADISEDDKRRLIEELWSITVSFTRLGYGLSPVRQVLDHRSKSACGKVSENRDDGPIPSQNEVEYSRSIIENFASSAQADGEGGVSS